MKPRTIIIKRLPALQRPLQFLARKFAAYKMQSPPDFRVHRPTGVYLRRWHTFPRNRFGNIYVHLFTASDDQRALHDHPWPSMSFVIEGSYSEIVPENAQQPGGPTTIHHMETGNIIIRTPQSAHRVVIPEGKHAITLFFTGPRTREWGFWCPKNRFVPYRTFLGHDQSDGLDNGDGPGCDA